MVSQNATAMILSLVSGLSTTLGGLIVILFDKPSENTVGWMLGMKKKKTKLKQKGISSGVMLFVSTIDLLPESVEKVGIPVSIFCVCKIFFFLFF